MGKINQPLTDCLLQAWHSGDEKELQDIALDLKELKTDVVTQTKQKK